MSERCRHYSKINLDAAALAFTAGILAGWAWLAVTCARQMR